MAIITFVDQTGLNPVAPGVSVSIYLTSLLPAAPAALAISGMIADGGAFDVGSTLTASTSYTAVFTGSVAPAASQSFTTPASGNFSVTVALYRSPYFSGAGYQAQLRDNDFPAGWDGAPTTDIPLNATLAAIGALLAKVSAKAQQIRAYSRLQGCVGGALDSWARDFFANTVSSQRLPGETDNAYRTWLQTLWQLKRPTISGITAIVGRYYQQLALVLALDNQSGAFDVGGGLGVDSVLPTVSVFDLMTDPTQSAKVPLVDAAGQFCVKLTYPHNYAAMFVLDVTPLDGKSCLVDELGLNPLTFPDAALLSIINASKAEGTTPVFAVAYS